MSILPSWIAYLCLAFILLLGVTAFAFLIIMIVTMVRHWNDKDLTRKLPEKVEPQSTSQYEEAHEPTSKKAADKKKLSLTETVLALGLLGLIVYIASRRKN